MGPIDYSIDVQTPFQAALQGYAGGAAIRDDQAKQAQMQAAQLQQEQMKMDIAALIANPNASGRDYAAATLKYPQLKDQFKQAWGQIGEEKKKSTLDLTSRAYAALSSGQPDIAEKIIRDQADAMRNSGAPEEQVKAQEMWANLIKASPDQARHIGGLMLSSVMEPEQFASTFATVSDQSRKADLAPGELAKSNADAIKARAEAKIKGVEAGNVETATALENTKAAEDIETARANRQIAALNVQIAQANSETQRGQLVMERDKLMAQQTEKKQASEAASQDALDSASALLEQINGVAKHPGLDAGTGTLSGVRSFFKSSDAADFRKAVEGLKSPVFLNELAKLKAAGITLGQVTEAEGGKLERRIANLDPDQSTPQFRNQVGVLLRDTEQFIKKIQSSGKLPTKGGAFVMDHPTYGRVDEGKINSLLQKYPGATRQQVLQYLEQTAPEETVKRERILPNGRP